MIRKLKSGGYRLYSRKVNPKTGRRRNEEPAPQVRRARDIRADLPDRKEPPRRSMACDFHEHLDPLVTSLACRIDRSAPNGDRSRAQHRRMAGRSTLPTVRMSHPYSRAPQVEQLTMCWFE